MKTGQLLRILMLAIILLGLTASASARPDFTGKWKLDADKSYLGPFATVQVLTREVRHDDPRLTIGVQGETSKGRVSGELRFVTQREEVKNTIGGVETTGYVMWLGDHLLMKTTRVWEGVETTLEELWSVSEDGMTLRIDAVVTTPHGHEELLFVFQKQ